MAQKLIKINQDHYVVVDDSKIEVGDWVCTNGGGIRHITKLNHDEKGTFTDDGLLSKKDASELCYICNYKKITHSTKPLEIIKGIGENSSINYYYGTDRLSLQEVKELIGEVDVEKKTENYAKDGLVLDTPYANGLFYGYIKGYTQALEDNKEKKYTRNEVHALMCKAFQQGFKKAYVVEAGLEGLETDVECAWILTKHDSTPEKTEWEVQIVDGKLKLKL